MVRVCSSSSEMPSLLRVDGRKKQLTLCQSHRRSSSSPPKIFPFDAIFSHDASQVSQDLDREPDPQKHCSLPCLDDADGAWLLIG